MIIWDGRTLNGKAVLTLKILFARVAFFRLLLILNQASPTKVFLKSQRVIILMVLVFSEIDFFFRESTYSEWFMRIIKVWTGFFLRNLKSF